MQDEEWNNLCSDCREKATTHCNVFYGTYVCEECAKEHQKHFSQSESYIKPIQGECYDNFQIACMQLGGNKKFNVFMTDYNKGTAEIKTKYCGSSAKYYKKRLCAQASNSPFTAQQPAKNMQEEAKMAAENSADWVKKMDGKYEVSQSVEEAAIIAGNAIASGFSKFAGWATGKSKKKQAAAQ